MPLTWSMWFSTLKWHLSRYDLLARLDTLLYCNSFIHTRDRNFLFTTLYSGGFYYFLLMMIILIWLTTCAWRDMKTWTRVIALIFWLQMVCQMNFICRSSSKWTFVCFRLIIKFHRTGAFWLTKPITKNDWLNLQQILFIDLLGIFNGFRGIFCATVIR